jgi:glycosyltransferase involved in cell wall biosynthesis
VTVTVLHYLDSDAFGGAEQSMLHLFAHTDRRAFSPILLMTDPPLPDVLREARALDVPVRTVPRARGATNVVAAIRLAGALRGGGHLFHAHLTWALGCSWAILTARAVGLPIVATVQLFMPGPHVPLSRTTARLIPRLVDRYVAVSPGIATALQSGLRVPGERIAVVSNGVPHRPWTPEEREARRRSSRARVFRAETRPIVLVVARLERQKGHTTLLRAAAGLPSMLFAFAGSGPDHAALVRNAAALGVADRVLFLGHRTDVPDLLAAADVFVLPSSNEGLPLALLEATAAGIPVIASDIGGNRDIVTDGETGLLVPVDDANALGSAINRLVQDPAYARRLGEAGAARFEERYTATAMARGVERVYREVLDRSANRWPEAKQG